MNARRYALASNADSDAGLVWSTGGCWSAGRPAAEKLMTGAEADAMLARHPQAVIVDVVVYDAMAAVWNAAFRAVVGHGDRSTAESRAKARDAGRQALIAAGYRHAAERANPFNPCAA